MPGIQITRVQVARRLLALNLAIDTRVVGVTRANGALVRVPVLLHQSQLAIQLTAALGWIGRRLTVDALSLVISISTLGAREI